MATIYYWRGAVGGAHFIGEHQEAIDKLIHNTYAKGDLEMLKGHRENIFSYRLNRSGRLLFTTIDIEGHRYLLLLEHLPTHDYQKSRFLRSGVLNRYLLAHEGDMLAAALVFQPVHNVDLGLQALGIEDKPAIALDYYHKEFIQLSDRQQEALQIPLPAIISGVAGSGKSCVAMTLLSNYVHKHNGLDTAEPRTLLYVTESFKLTRTMERSWAELPIAEQQPLSITIQFKTYDELLVELAELNGKTLVYRADFDTWFDQYTKRQQKLMKKSSVKTDPLDVETTYQEFRVCSAYTQADYCDLGDRQSSLPRGVARETLYTAYQAYLAHLDEKNVLHPAFHILAHHETHDLIVVDESQDFSHRQLKNLASLAKHRHAAFCMDSHQSLCDRLSKRPFLRDMLRHHKKDQVSHVELPITYRCPLKIAQAANLLIQIKCHLTGGIADQLEAPSVVPNIAQGASIGHLLVINQHTMSSWIWLQEQSKGAHFAVVTTPEFIEKALKLFPQNRVFTPDEIKGLEYDTVLVLHPFSSIRMKEASKQIGDVDETIVRHRPKADARDDTFAPDFSQLFTSITRAKRALVICEELTRETAAFLNPLKKIMGEGPLPLEQAERLQKTTVDEWEIEILRHVDQGQMLRALDIFRVQFNPSEDAFKAFVAKHRQKDTPVVASPLAPLSATTIQQPSPIKDFVTQTPRSHIGAKKTSSPGQGRERTTVTHEPAPLSQKATHILALLNDFSEKHLKRFLLTMDFDTHWFRTLVEFEGQSLSLLHHVMKSIDRTTQLTTYLFTYPDEIVKITNNKRNVKYLLRALQEQDKTLSPRVKDLFIKMLLLCDPTLSKEPYVYDLIKCALKADDTCEIDQSLLYWLAKYNFGQIALKYLFITYSKFMAQIPPERWAATSVKNANISPLYMLTLERDGREILIKWLEKHPTMFATIPHQAWALPLTAQAGCDENASPLLALTMSNEGQEILIRMLDIRPDILSAIAPNTWARSLTAAAGNDKNVSPLYCLASSDKGLEFLTLLYEKMPAILAAIPPEAWALPLTADERANTSPLYLITSSVEGRKLLKLMLDRTPDILAAIAANAWALPLTAAGEHQHTSPLYCLTSTDEGLALLKLMLEKMPHILAAISPSAWALAVTFCGESNFSPLYWLTSSDEGATLLKLMLETAPSILAAIPPDAWALPLTEASGAEANYSPLYWLTSTDEGPALLKLMLETAPRILAAIPPDAWALPLTEASGVEANYSPLYWLTSTDEGPALLKLMLETAPGILAAIPPDAWALPLTAEAGHEANFSPLYWLVSCEEGLEYLELMWEKMPDIIAAIPPDAWALASTAASGDKANHSPLYWLSSSKDGRKLLGLMLEKMPNIIAAIPHSAWVLPLTAASGEEANMSPLFWLTSNDEASVLLELMLKKTPDILAAIPPSAWALPLTAAAGDEANTSPLYWLTVNDEGREVLKLMLKKTPTILAAIPPNAWALSLTAAAGISANASPLYWLASINGGPALLKRILETAPNILRAIPLSAWTLPLTAAAGMNANASPLFWLASCDEGAAVIKLILETAPEILAAIPPDAWALPLTAAAGDEESTSALYWLTSIDEGPSLFKLMLEKAPGILAAIPPDAWALPRKAAADDEANASPLYQLTSSEKGRDVLKLMLVKIPGILAAIPLDAWTLKISPTASKSANASPLFWLSSYEEGREILVRIRDIPPVNGGAVTTNEAVRPTLDNTTTTSQAHSTTSPAVDSETAVSQTSEIQATPISTLLDSHGIFHDQAPHITLVKVTTQDALAGAL